MKKRIMFALLAVLFLFPACGTMHVANPPVENKFVLLASTIGPIDAGIVGALEDGFEKETGIRVRHVGAGTAAALKMGKSGQFDLCLAHAKALEEQFIQEGFGTERIPLMYNDFVIMGPAADPAGIKGMKTAAQALKTIAAKKATFITRGDRSGTNMSELGLWKGAGIQPTGSWYVKYEQGTAGNMATLRYTDKKQAYTVIDRATYLALKKEITLAILVENDEAMLNFMSLIPVNSAKFPKVNREGAMKFIGWMTAADKGQIVIRDFGKDKYGEPMFFPNSREWHQMQKSK